MKLKGLGGIFFLIILTTISVNATNSTLIIDNNATKMECIGTLSDDYKSLAQSFIINSSMCGGQSTCAIKEINASFTGRQGVPADNIQVRLYTNGTNLTSNPVADSTLWSSAATITSSALPAMTNVNFTYLNSGLIINTNTMYNVVFNRTGTESNTAYVCMVVNESDVQPYPEGLGYELKVTADTYTWQTISGTTGALRMSITYELNPFTNYTYEIKNVSYYTPVYESLTTNFTINLSWGANVTNITAVNFSYNGTNYTASLLSNGTIGSNNTWKVFNVSNFVVPNVYGNNTFNFNWSYYGLFDNGTSFINTTINYTQLVLDYISLNVTYLRNVSNGTINFARNLSINITYSCAANTTAILFWNINSSYYSNETIFCNTSSQNLSKFYQNSVEGNFTINFTIAIGTNNISSNNTPFVSDLYSPLITNLSIDTHTNFFNASLDFNMTMICRDNMQSPLNYTFIVNSIILYNSTRNNNTNQTNQTTLISGINNVTGICADSFGNVTNQTSITIMQILLALIDEKLNTDFEVNNITSARVYMDNNNSYFDFKTHATNTTNFTYIYDGKLRFELVMDDLGTTITRYIDVGLLNNTNESTLRVCANRQLVTHYEQLITSAIVKPVVLKSIFSNCYIAADYTRFAYEYSKVLKAFTIQTQYILYNFENGLQTFLAGIDGSIQTVIDLDRLEYLSTPYNFNVIKSAMTYQKTSNTTMTIRYENLDNDEVSGNLTIINVSNGAVLYELTSFLTPSNWSVVFNFGAFNLSNTTMMLAQYTSVDSDGQSHITKAYFTPEGNSGVIRNEIAAMLAVIFLLFGITLTSSRITFAWFGIFVCLGTFFILTMAIGGVWYITFLQAINGIVLVYIVLNLINQNGATLT